MAQAYDTLPLSVTLRRETYHKLTATLRDMDPGTAISTQVTQFLESRCDGAILIKTEDIAKIESAIGKTVATAKDIVAAALKSAHIDEDGQRTYRFGIDPEFQSLIEENARAAGVTPEDMIAEVVHCCLLNNWVLDLPFEGHSRLFTVAQERWFCKELGTEDFVVQDLQRHIKELKKAPVHELVSAAQ